MSCSGDRASVDRLAASLESAGSSPVARLSPARPPWLDEDGEIDLLRLRRSILQGEYRVDSARLARRLLAAAAISPRFSG